MIKIFGCCFLLSLLVSVSNAQSSAAINGKVVFESKCKRCHGADGTKGMFGAKDLSESRRDTLELFTIISNGRKLMPAWRKRLTESQIKEVIAYIQLLRK